MRLIFMGNIMYDIQFGIVVPAMEQALQII